MAATTAMIDIGDSVVVLVGVFVVVMPEIVKYEVPSLLGFPVFNEGSTLHVNVSGDIGRVGSFDSIITDLVISPL